METKTELTVSFKPTKKHIKELESWLLKEQRKTAEGFYCNWNTIRASYVKEQIAIITDQDSAIGFATWYIHSGHTASIEISEIKRAYRRKGTGRFFILKLFEYFLKQGVLVVDVQCKPVTSIPFWKNLDFVEFPDGYYIPGTDKWLYRALIPASEPSKAASIETGESVQLWDDDPIHSRDTNPRWIWKLEFKRGTRQLKDPIIFPCESDWRIDWQSGKKVLRTGKAKYFRDGQHKVGRFLIIEG